MRWIQTAPLLFMFQSVTLSAGIEIQSEPAVNAEELIRTELDKTVSLTCLSSGSAGAEQDQELVWLRNGALVNLMEGNREGQSRLCVSPVTREDDAATFTCQMKGDASVNASVTLDVTYAPVLSATADVLLEEKATLELQCDIRANPPVEVSWQKEDAVLDLSAGGFTVTTDGFTTWLKVGAVDRGLHQGTYRCVTKSPMYGTQSKAFNVTITDKVMGFPLMPLVAGLVVVFCTSVLAVVSRWERITKCCKSN
ncbi:transmembrane and immunoglobulin domain-containing protein 1 [Lampris incognitus]|uniref:transmembrane and immunoglobulin domain-containing protein 1 n=1 Tax=Lampris incognitus TaxID=2546036 RepID=UPI0024B51E36|nr:transmembrane and immunoglobulin domain-containing protein 1 [Lampris incognitus]